MNDRSRCPDARYSTHHMGMGFELADEGEVYMICQGTGGGYGDVLEREPGGRRWRTSRPATSRTETAREIYFVVFDEETLAVDVEPRPSRRARPSGTPRTARGVPYAEFVEELGDRRATRRTCPTTARGARTTPSCTQRRWTTTDRPVAGPAHRRAAADLPAGPEPAGHPRPVAGASIAELEGPDADGCR